MVSIKSRRDFTKFEYKELRNKSNTNYTSSLSFKSNVGNGNKSVGKTVKGKIINKWD